MLYLYTEIYNSSLCKEHRQLIGQNKPLSYGLFCRFCLLFRVI